jgi:hypothetical protein
LDYIARGAAIRVVKNNNIHGITFFNAGYVEKL